MKNKIILYKTLNKIYCLTFDSTTKLIQVVYDNVNQLVGTIYLAKVINVNHKNHTAFIEYAEQKIGFINYNPQYTPIQIGSKLLVQLQWLGDTEKNPKFSCNIKLIGKYVILCKIGRGLRFSSKLNKMISKKLIELFSEYSNYNITFRTKVGTCDDLSLIKSEIDLLINQYENLLKNANSLNSPKQLLNGYYNYMLYLNAIDNLEDIDIITNSHDIYISLPNENIQLDLNLNLDINQLINSYSNSKVHIHKLSGINLLDIDGNNHMLNDFQTNYLIIEEIIHLIMIHDLTGIILIDMIKNMSSYNEEVIYNKFVKQLKECDWRNCQILGFTKAGIFEIIRSK